MEEITFVKVLRVKFESFLLEHFIKFRGINEAFFIYKKSKANSSVLSCPRRPYLYILGKLQTENNFKIGHNNAKSSPKILNGGLKVPRLPQKIRSVYGSTLTRMTLYLLNSPQKGNKSVPTSSLQHDL